MTDVLWRNLGRKLVVKDTFKKLGDLWAPQNSIYVPTGESDSLEPFYRVEITPLR